HHHIGVINKLSFAIYCLISMENYRSHILVFAELDKKLFVGSRRECTISFPISSVQHYTSGSFQEHIGFFSQSIVSNVFYIKPWSSTISNTSSLRSCRRFSANIGYRITSPFS